jgi:hypothetical protein
MDYWYQLKMFMAHTSDVSMDAWHILAGAVLQLTLAAIFRRSVASLLPWVAVLVLELANELADLWVEQWPDPGMQWGEGAKDIALTMALPTLFLLVSRFYPRVLTATSRGAPALTLPPGPPLQTAASDRVSESRP